MDRTLLSIILIIVVTLCLRHGRSDAGAGPTTAMRRSSSRHLGGPGPGGAPGEPGLTGQGLLEEGAKLYKTYCASCHGEQGRGDGPASAGLTPGRRTSRT